MEEQVKEKPKHLANHMARNASFLVLVLAIIISGYLSYLKVANAEAVCVEASVFDCGTVLNSFYSEIRGVPIAWLGLTVNIIAVALLLLEPRVPILQHYGVALIFGLILFAFLFSIYLVYVQAALIKSYCPWCLTHEALITILFFLSAWRLSQWELA
jgi:uncharacterized membrane protein